MPFVMVARRRRDRYIPQESRLVFMGTVMRAEIQTIVDEIKQSVGLLRRHL